MSCGDLAWRQQRQQAAAAAGCQVVSERREARLIVIDAVSHMHFAAAVGSCRPAAAGRPPPTPPGHWKRQHGAVERRRALSKCGARPDSPYEPLERAVQVRRAPSPIGRGFGLARSHQCTSHLPSPRRDGAFVGLGRRRCRRRRCRRRLLTAACSNQRGATPYLALFQVINRVIAVGEKAKWGSGEAGSPGSSSAGGSEGSPAQERWVQFAAVYNASLAVDQPAPGALPPAAQQQQAVNSSASSYEQQQGSSGNGSSSGSSGNGSNSSSGSSNGGSSSGASSSGGSGPSGRLLRDYLALPIEQYSLLDPKWISRLVCCKWLDGQACRLHVAHMGWGIQSGLAPLTAVRCAPSALPVCPQFAALLLCTLQGGGRHVPLQPAAAGPSECGAAA